MAGAPISGCIVTKDAVREEIQRAMHRIKKTEDIAIFRGLAALAEKIMDPAVPVYSKTSITSNMVGYASRVKSIDEWSSLAYLIDAYMALDGYGKMSGIMTQQEHYLMGSTWHSQPPHMPSFLATPLLGPVDLPKIAPAKLLNRLSAWFTGNAKNKANGTLLGRLRSADVFCPHLLFEEEELRALPDGSKKTALFAPGVSYEIINEGGSLKAYRRMDVEWVNNARKMMAHSGSLSRHYKTPENIGAPLVIISLEPLGPDGITLRDPRVIDISRLEKLAKDDPRLENYSHEQIIEICSLGYGKSADFPYGRD